MSTIPKPTKVPNGPLIKPNGSTLKSGGWIGKAVNPKHKGFCTPESKATCTPKRKALAHTFKKIAAKRKKS